MGSRHQGPQDEKDALDTFIKLQRASETLNAAVNTEIASYGLTTSQFAAMEAIYHIGPMCLRDIGRKILKSGGNMTLVVDNLEKGGYVVRERSERDRRHVTVHLTEAGQTKMASIFPQHAQTIGRLMSVLTPEEQAHLGALSRKLGLGIHDAFG